MVKVIMMIMVIMLVIIKNESMSIVLCLAACGAAV